MVHQYLLHIPRLRLMFYVYESGDNGYPINLLRNLATLNSITQFYINLDFDLWISKNTYNEVKRIPSNYWRGKSAFIIPAFQAHPDIVMKCMNDNYCNFSIPQTKDDLESLYWSHQVTHANPKQPMHSYANKTWFQMKGLFTQLYPLIDRIELYYVLKKSNYIPLFNPFFTNYGRNKEALYQMLKFDKYKMYVMNHCFGFDFLHTKEYTRYDTYDREKKGFVLLYKMCSNVTGIAILPPTLYTK